MTLAYASAAQRFEAAREAFLKGRPDDAARLLNAVLQSDPRSAPALHLMGLSLMDLGDLAQAEQALRASIASDKKRAPVHAALGQVLQRTGRAGEAEKAFRTGVALERMHVGAVVGLADVVMADGRLAEAMQLTTPLVVAADAPASVLEMHAQILKRLGRLDESLAMLQRAVAAGSSYAELETAIVLRELGRYEEAEGAARRAVAKIGEHPVVMSTLGHTLQDQRKLDEAEAVYRQALTKAPFDPNLHLALAGFLWSRTGDPDRAAAALDSVLRQRATTPLLAIRAKLYTRAGKPKEAYALLAEAAKAMPDDAVLHASTATAAVHAGEPEAGMFHAERAVALRPDIRKINTLLAECSLAAGRADRAGGIIADLRSQDPLEQQFIAMQAVVWRMLGDDRYRELYDYDAMVQTFTIPTPDGWPTLPAYLADLAATLKNLHAMRGDPLDQSLRKGTQTEQNLALSTDPVIRAFFKAIDAPIGDYLARLGKGRDPLRGRVAKGHRVKGGWSVKLEPNGFHVDHLHPDGWISSAFYVELPKAMGEQSGKEGWIKFGQPGAPTNPALEAEHFVRPEAGRLVLFPSYMWHGTVPFGGDDTRLTMAFDAVPVK